MSFMNKLLKLKKTQRKVKVSAAYYQRINSLDCEFC